MSQREELVQLASSGLSIAELSRRFGVSRKTIYKWIKRHREEGKQGLQDRSRRPVSSPQKASAEIEQKVLSLRLRRPAWGGRKLSRVLRRVEGSAPSASTITRILQEHALVAPRPGHQQRWQRFERECPNELWQMDFKSPLALSGGGVCHALTVIDDHSRYALGVRACRNQQRETVQEELTGIFNRYGLPWAILTDNGPPWGVPAMNGLTHLAVWLMRLDIEVLHGRPYHPQTQGKDERFHRTLQVELLQDRIFHDQVEVQQTFDPWRDVYNQERPHEALGLATPAQRYRASERSMPRVLPPVEYGPGDQVRRVDNSGLIWFKARRVRVGKALDGESVGLHPTTADGVWGVRYGRISIGQVNLKEVGVDEFVHVLRPRSSRCAPSAGTEHVETV